MAKIAVAPLVGAWIEIRYNRMYRCYAGIVAPLVGAWIEIYALMYEMNSGERRSPRGSVD